MSNVFDTRVLTADEQAKLKKTINDGIKYQEAIALEKDSLKDLIKSTVDALNDKIDDKDQHIKAGLVGKMIRAQYKQDLQESKDKVAEVEDGLVAIGKSV